VLLQQAGTRPQRRTPSHDPQHPHANRSRLSRQRHHPTPAPLPEQPARHDALPQQHGDDGKHQREPELQGIVQRHGAAEVGHRGAQYGKGRHQPPGVIAVRNAIEHHMREAANPR
jgi:hypothetical protein